MFYRARVLGFGLVAIAVSACGSLKGYQPDESVCDVEDDDVAYGFGPFDAVDLGVLPDDGETIISRLGEIDTLTDHHWYVVQTVDDPAADILAGRNAYNFQVKLDQRADAYRMTVYRNDYIPSAAECSGGSDYTEYSDFYVDTEHAGLADPQACGGPNVEGLNECEDMGATYYIEVYRISEGEKCGAYELSLANGDIELVSVPEEED